MKENSLDQLLTFTHVFQHESLMTTNDGNQL